MKVIVFAKILAKKLIFKKVSAKLCVGQSKGARQLEKTLAVLHVGDFRE